MFTSVLLTEMYLCVARCSSLAMLAVHNLCTHVAIISVVVSVNTCAFVL